MLAAKDWIEQGVPNGGIIETTEGAEGACNHIERTTISNNRPPRAPRD
jgi:hypothetical protein